MQCPVCKEVSLVMSDRQGIEIDYCPQCRGVWLDRGELDKIIDRSVATMPAAMPQQQAPAYPVQQPVFGHQQQHSHHQQPYDSRYHKKKKREGFLGELFDFD